MAVSLSELQSLLLDLLSSRVELDRAAIDALSAEDWRRLLDKAAEHRLLPLLHWCLRHQRPDLHVPESVRARSEKGFKRSAMRSLRLQRELLLIHRCLQEAGIPHLALKGAFLAFHTYPHAALRPMRDLDILVPESRVLDAYQTLIAAGYVRPPRFAGDLEATAQLNHHLPPLMSPTGGISIEVHMRLFRPEESQDGADAAQDEGFWQRASFFALGEERIAYLSPTDLLLHLIEHAIYHHRLDNGPLILTDIAFLTTRYPIDWPLFWQLVDRRQKRRGVELLLRMVERYFNELPISWPEDVLVGDATLNAMVGMTPELMLRSLDSRADTHVACAVQTKQGWRKKLGVYWGRLFLTRGQLAMQYPVRQDSILVYPWYVARAWKLLFRRLPDYVRHRREIGCQNEVQQITRLNSWLHEEG